MKVAIAFLVFGVLFSVCARDRSPERRMPRGECRARFEQPAIPQSLLSAERGEFRGMRYRRIAMNMNGAGDPHLVLVLHGRSASGDDNTRQLSSPAILSLVEYLRNTGTKCVVLIPQCPRNRDWLRGGADSMLDHAADLVKKEVRESGISSGRTYVTGVSMGGGACYAIMSSHPGLFAGAVVASSGGRPGTALPRGRFFIIHGENDRLIPLAKAERMAQALTTMRGSEVKFVALPGKGHIDGARSAYTPACWNWLFNGR